jgi:hypothetical protein
MNEEALFQTYLRARADALEVPSRDRDTITARSARWQHAGLLVATVTVFTVLAGAIAWLAASNAPGSVDVGDMTRAGRIEPGLDWRVVDVPAGLGYSASTAVAGDGTIYALTLKGWVGDPRDKLVLYRSADGEVWEPLPLPPGMEVADRLAAYADRVYVVGTAPAGATVEVVVAASTDGRSWATTRIPAPRAHLAPQAHRAGWGDGDVHLEVGPVTAGPHGVTVGVGLKARTGRSLLPVPELPATDRTVLVDPLRITWTTPNGVEEYGRLHPSGAGCDRSSPTTPGTHPSGPTGTTPPAAPPVLCDVHTWERLNIDPEIGQLLAGEMHLYVVAHDGASGFEELAPLPQVEAESWSTRLFDTDAGYVAVGSSRGEARLGSPLYRSELVSLWSADGRSWQEAGPLPISKIEGLVDVGLLDGRPALAGFRRDDPDLWLATADATGRWTGIALPADSTGAIRRGAFGPGGFVALAWRPDGDPGNEPDNEPDRFAIVESPDGRSFSTRPVTDLFTGGEWEFGSIIPTADSVIIPLWPPLKTDRGHIYQPEAQRLLIGSRR